MDFKKFDKIQQEISQVRTEAKKLKTELKMAGDEPKNMLTTKTIYTFNEAIELMKRRDRYTTNKRPIQWIDAKTKKRVHIGYNG